MKRLVVLSTLLALAGCAGEPAAVRLDASTTSPAAPTTSQTPDRPELFGSGMVLQNGDGEARLCLGGVATSLPPQCDGPPIGNWDWAKVPGHHRDGVTWGSFVVVGTYDGSRFTLTRPAVTPGEYDGPRPVLPEDPPLTTPCPVPTGGWHVRDPARTTRASLDRTLRAASRLQGFADSWVDQSINQTRNDARLNDPTRLVLNVRVTGDAAAVERQLRETWGGSLCVTKALRSRAKLRTVLERLRDLPQTESLSLGRDQVDLQVFYDDGSLQRSLDEEYGVGVVVVTSDLQPFPQG